MNNFKNEKNIDAQFLALIEELLVEKIVKPTANDKKNHKETHKDGGKLYYLVKSEKNVNKGYIDEKYIKDNNYSSPEAAARGRLREIEYFKGNGQA